METKRIYVLMVVDGKKDREEIFYFLNQKKNFKVEAINHHNEVLEKLEKTKKRCDVIILEDFSSDKYTSILKTIKKIKEISPETVITLITESCYDSKINTYSDNITLYYKKPLNLEELSISIELACIRIHFDRERRISNILQNLSLEINSTTELENILKLTCKAAVDILNVDHSGLVRFDKDQSKGQVIAEYPLSTAINHRKKNVFKGEEIQVKGIPAEESLVYHRKIINIPDLDNDCSLKEVKEILAKYGIQSMLAVPVVLNGKVIASVSMDMIKKKRWFYDDEITLCKKLASLVAVAIGKANYVNQLTVLNQIGQTLSTSAEKGITEILDLIYEQTGRLMDVHNFYIAFIESEKNIKFKFVVEKGKIQNIRDGEYRDREFANGLTEYMIRTKQSLLIKNNTIKFLADHGLDRIGEIAESWIGAPLIVGKKILGVIGLQHFETENVYDENDLKVLSTIASQAAIAIENARLLQEKELRYKELDALYCTSIDITKQLELDPLLKSIVKRAAELLNAPCGGLLLREGKKHEIEMKYTHNLDSMLEMRFDFGQGMTGQVALSGKPMIINDYHNWDERDIRFDEAKYNQLFREIVAVPLKWEEEVIGVLAISDIAPNRIFKGNDIKLLERFASQAAIAIINATLFNRKVRELEALRSADIALLSTMGQSEMLETIINELSNFVSCNAYVIRLWDEENRELRLELEKGEHPGKIPLRKSTSMGISGLAAHTKKMIVSNNLRKDPSYKKALKDTKNQEESEYLRWIGSEVAVPLLAKEKLVGVLAALKDQKNGFNERDRHIMELFAGPAAIALYNTRLIHRSRQHTILVAHQLKGPLQAIRGDVDLQKQHIEEKYRKDELLSLLNRRLDEHFGKIKKELDNFSFLIRDDLVGNHKYSMKEMSIHHVIDESAAQFREYAKERGIKIIVEKNLHNLPRFKFDRENMFTVFTNLVENAVKYSQDHKDVKISGEKKENWIRITVSNVGLGVLPEDKDRLFDLYTQGKLKSKKRFVQGTGIGLWVVKKIVNAHSGDINVSCTLFNHPELISKINDIDIKGFYTQFIVELPV